jgi:HSP20 family protein
MDFKDYRDIIRQMEREMQQISDEAFRGFFAIPVGGAGRFWQPAIDIHETERALVVKVELAGAKVDDLTVTLSPDDRVLVIGGSRSESHDDRSGRSRCHQLEIYFGPFERAVALPSAVPIERDRITATYREGFLLIALPKKTTVARQQKRTIKIEHISEDQEIAQREGGKDVR